MKLQIPITEAISLIKAKTGKNISLKVVNLNTVNVGYDLMVKVPLLGDISKNVNIDITIEKLVCNTLYILYSSGIVGMDVILRGIINAVPSFSSKGIIENLGGNRIALHLSEIDEIREALKQVDIKNVNFECDKAIVDFAIKV